MKIRTYSELISLPTYKERFEYLKLSGVVGEETFGHNRHMNQIFYRSQEWRNIRNRIITRDSGCDLGVIGMVIPRTIYIHHINPITIYDLFNMTDMVYNPEYLICVSKQTHDALHYGDGNSIPMELVVRKPNDTNLW